MEGPQRENVKRYSYHTKTNEMRTDEATKMYATREKGVNDIDPTKTAYAWRTMIDEFNEKFKKKRTELATNHNGRTVYNRAEQDRRLLKCKNFSNEADV